MRIDHINISAPIDLLAAEKRFFCDVLGLSEGFRPNFSSNGYWLYSGDKAIVHLTESNMRVNNEQPGYFDHVAFQLTGLQKFIRRLTEMEISYTPASLDEIGTTQIFLKTPAGIKIEGSFANEEL
jgi:catechol 2,3-dioxygenase-like lactoylglutathione lyase family enzyme